MLRVFRRLKINFNILLVCLLIVTLIVLSLVFYKQRIAYHDTASYFMSLVCKNEFSISHSRYISIVSQWLPLLLLKLDSSFKTLAISYSVANVLFPSVLSLICIGVFKDTYKGLAILIYWILLDSYLFYYTCSEVPMGLALLLFYDSFWSYCDRKNKGWLLFTIVTVIVIPLVLFSHPINLLIIFAWLGYRYIRQRYVLRREYLIISIVTIIAYIIKKLYFVSTYEMEKSPGFEKLSKLSFDMYTRALASSFYRTLIDDSFFLPLMFIAALILLFRKKEKVLSGYIFLVVAFFFTLILLVFQNDETIYNQYYEHLMQPLSFFVVLAFMDLLPYSHQYKVAEKVFLVAVSAVSISKIITGNQVVTDRHQWYAEKFKVMDNCGIRKAIIERDEVPYGVDKSSYWNAADETLFLTALDGNKHNKSIFMAWGWVTLPSLGEGNEQTVLHDGYRNLVSDYPARYFDLGHERYTFIRRDTCIKH